MFNLMNKLKKESELRLNSGIRSFQSGDYNQAYQYFEESHILGQTFIKEHTLSHWWMLRVAFRTNDAREVIGQIPRMMASVVFSKIWVPKGNSGRAVVSALQAMPIPEHLQEYYRE